MDHVNGLDSVVKGLVNRFKCRPEQLGERVATLTEELKSTQKALVEVNSQLALAKSASLVGDAETLPSGVKILVKRMEGVDGKSLQEAAKSLQEALGDSAAVVLGSAAASLDGGSSKVFLAVAFSPAVVKEGGMQAGKFVGGVAKVCGGGGGGKANLAQAGGKDASKLDEALEMALRDLKVAL
jgi:alanyl-tRNA synthetase